MSKRDKHYAADVTIIGDIISTVPVTDDKGNSYDDARRILNSDWLAARDARMKAEALEEAAEAFDSGEVAPDDLKHRTPDAPKGWSDVSIVAAFDSSGPVMDWLRARAADYRAEMSHE